MGRLGFLAGPAPTLVLGLTLHLARSLQVPPLVAVLPLSLGSTHSSMNLCLDFGGVTDRCSRGALWLQEAPLALSVS